MRKEIEIIIKVIIIGAQGVIMICAKKSGGWVGGLKAFLNIAYSNQKLALVWHLIDSNIICQQ